MKYDLYCSIKQTSLSSSGSLNLSLVPCAKCLSRISDVTVKPCGHKVLCRNCCIDVTHCPICETFIMQRKAGEGVQTFESVKFAISVFIQMCIISYYSFHS